MSGGRYVRFQYLLKDSIPLSHGRTHYVKAGMPVSAWAETFGRFSFNGNAPTEAEALL